MFTVALEILTNLCEVLPVFITVILVLNLICDILGLWGSGR